MSHVLNVYEGPPPASFADALAELRLREDAFARGDPPSERIREFVDAMLSRWPDITEEAGEDSPWSDGPMISNAAGTTLAVGIVYSHLEEATEFLTQLARDLQLVLLDQGEELVLVPQLTGAPPGAPRSKQRKGFFRRR